MLKTNRSIKNLTTYDLGHQTGVSNAYISKIENGSRLPSETVLFSLVLNLGFDSYSDVLQLRKNTDSRLYSSVKILTKYAEYKNINKDDLLERYDDFHFKYLESLKVSKKDIDKINEHEIKIPKNSSESINIEEPYLDLKWLLTQDKYEVFYGKDYDFLRLKGEKFDPDIIGFHHHHLLNREDLQTIYNVIEEILSNKYEKNIDKNRNDYKYK